MFEKFKINWHCIQNIVLTGGAIIAEVGTKLFATKAMLEYLEVENPAALLATEIVVITSSVYVFIFSRGLINWRLTSNSNTGSMKKLLEQVKSESLTLGPCGKAGALSVLTVGVVMPTISNGLVAYYGSDVFLRYLGVNNTLALYCLDTYLGITSGLTFVYFALPVGVKNLFSFFRKVTGRSRDTMAIYSAIIGGGLGTIRTVSQVCTSNFIIKHALQTIDPLSSITYQEAISAGITLSAVPICSQNRAIELYHRMKAYKWNSSTASDSKSDDAKPEEVEAAPLKQRVLFRVHDLNSILYTLIVFGVSYIGCVDLEENQFNYNSRAWYFILGNIIASISGATVEYAFTNVAMYRESRSMFFSKPAPSHGQLARSSLRSPLLGVRKPDGSSDDVGRDASEQLALCKI